jgi:hypothetical protein
MLSVMRRHNLPIQRLSARVCAVQFLNQMKAMSDVVLLEYKD